MEARGGRRRAIKREREREREREERERERERERDELRGGGGVVGIPTFSSL